MPFQSNKKKYLKQYKCHVIDVFICFTHLLYKIHKLLLFCCPRRRNYPAQTSVSNKIPKNCPHMDVFTANLSWNELLLFVVVKVRYVEYSFLKN